MILNPSVSALDSVKTWGPYLYSAVSDAFPTLCVYCGRTSILPNPEFCICRKISLILQDFAVLCRTILIHCTSSIPRVVWREFTTDERGSLSA